MSFLNMVLFRLSEWSDFLFHLLLVLHLYS